MRPEAYGRAALRPPVEEALKAHGLDTAAFATLLYGLARGREHRRRAPQAPQEAPE